MPVTISNELFARIKDVLSNYMFDEDDDGEFFYACYNNDDVCDLLDELKNIKED